MSRSLLFQLSEAVGGIAMSQNSWKHASHSRAKVPPLIMHGYQDDLESVFYVFIWICIGYSGPLGVKRVLEKRKQGEWLLHLWSADSFKEGGNEKTSFFFHPNADKLTQQFHPYFHDLLPLALDWYELIRGKGPSHALTFKEVIDLLTKHLDILPKDEPSPELLFAKKIIDALPNGLPAIPDALPGGKRKVASEAADKDVAHPPVMEHDTTFGGRVLWTMEPVPQPKRMRTT